jgi:hypothetical protein
MRKCGKCAGDSDDGDFFLFFCASRVATPKFSLGLNESESHRKQRLVQKLGSFRFISVADLIETLIFKGQT